MTEYSNAQIGGELIVKESFCYLNFSHEQVIPFLKYSAPEILTFVHPQKVDVCKPQALGSCLAAVAEAPLACISIKM